MDINQFTFFLHLSETLNFTEAAQLSGVSQPSLTKSIRRLEEELGGLLLYRDGKDTRLTALGREIQMEFLCIQAKIEKVKNISKNMLSGQLVVLSIGVASTISPKLLSAFWERVLQQLPSVEIHVLPMLEGENERDILSGKYDICVLTNPPRPNSKLNIQPLYDEAVGVAMSTLHPFASLTEVREEQLKNERYVERLHCEFRTQLVSHFMDRDIVMVPRFQSDREDWVQYMIAQNAGIGMIPEHSEIVGSIVVKPLENMSLSRQITMTAVSGTGSPKEVGQILKMAGAYKWV